jgi:hypothetical protein
VGAGLDALVRRQVEERSLAAKLAAGALIAVGMALLAQFAGADVRAGLGAGRPDLAHQVIRGMLSRPTALA